MELTECLSSPSSIGREKLGIGLLFRGATSIARSRSQQRNVPRQIDRLIRTPRITHHDLERRNGRLGVLHEGG